MSDSEEQVTVSFMEAQKEINKLQTQSIEEMKALLAGFIKQSSQGAHSDENQPPSKKRKREEASSSSTSDDAIQLHIEKSDVIADVDQVEGDEDEAWRTLPMHGKSLEEDGMQEAGTGDDEIERNLGSKYQELLDQTEEVLGDPISQDLADVCKKVWGQSVLTAEKKKQLFKGLEVPQNCQVLKAPRLNTKMYIRLNENAQTKDKGAQERQKGLSRAAIPLLQGMGSVDEAQIALHKQYPLFKEPKTLEEAKKQLKEAKAHAQAAYEATNVIRQKIQKSVSVLAYAFTQTTKKRKQDICWALGKEFSAYAQDTKTGEEELFPEEAIKAMKTELNAVKPKGQRDSTASKNLSSFGKTHRGQSMGNNSKKTYSNNSGNSNAYSRFNSKNGNNSYNNNNSNNNSNYNNKKFQKKH